jgi:hypothetical protein
MMTQTAAYWRRKCGELEQERDAALAHAATETADCIRLRSERDAALARAEAAEDNLFGVTKYWVTKYDEAVRDRNVHLTRALSAESALAEATALLERIEAVIERTTKSPAEPGRLGTWDAVCTIRGLIRASKAGGA